MLIIVIAVAVGFHRAWLSVPEPRTYTEAPTRLPMTVLPSQTPYQFLSMTPSPTVTAREALLSTRVPTLTVTPTMAPSETPTPARSPIQRG